MIWLGSSPKISIFSIKSFTAVLSLKVLKALPGPVLPVAKSVKASLVGFSVNLNFVKIFFMTGNAPAKIL